MGAETSNFVVPDPSWNVAAQNLPKAGMLVKYRTAFYQCLGYISASGRWVATDGQEEIMPVKSWRSIYDPVTSWPERA